MRVIRSVALVLSVVTLLFVDAKLFFMWRAGVFAPRPHFENVEWTDAPPSASTLWVFAAVLLCAHALLLRVALRRMRRVTGG